ncbi:MAG TPA: glucoamylase family protein [Bryobacteraceae bacterium]|nr:glucoamylase family protein [Bryobacteraceae bacterium]
MKHDSGRIVLGFFSPGAGDAAQALAGSRGRSRVVLLTPGSPGSAQEFAAPYADLRLPRESLVVARTTLENTGAVVRRFRAAGAPAIFVLRQGPEGPRVSPPSSPAVELSAEEDTFRRACRGLEEAQRLEHALTSAAEWLLDNSYLVLTNVSEMRRNLPREYSDLLKKGSRESAVKMRSLARELVATTDCAVNIAAIMRVLADPSIAAEFRMRDLWMFPFLLRWAIIETLTRLAAGVARSQQLRESAYLWANRLATSARTGPDLFAAMLARMEREPYALEPYFIVSLAEQLHDEENALAPAQRWMESRLEKPLTEVVQAEHTREAAERMSTANAFGSLRVLSRLEFSEIFESVSLVEAELRKDPMRVYPRSDAATRDDCRKVVEKVGRYSSHSEADVARCAVRLAARSGMDVTYFLLSRGLAELEAESGASIPFHARLVRAVRRHATAYYLGSQALLNLCFTALALMIAWDAGVHRAPELAILGALALFPLSDLSIQIVNALVISLLPPGRLAKMDFREHIPDEHATLVTVPMMLASVETVRQEVEKLEVRFLANQNDNLWFGLFADFLDAPEATAPDDSELLRAAREGIENLNRRYPGERFVLFHRAREWSESEQRWIGRERKRGKLDELNSFLLEGKSAKILVTGRLARPIRYVLTLDSDTALPPGAARRLVETIAHPRNHVELDPKTRVRRAGYAIIQPRISISLPDAMATRFTRIFAVSSGTDPYCKSVSDAQQDLFREAIFHGKAIYDVRSFAAALNHRFPRETLLSHDLIEGAYAGAALANDIELFENVPHNYPSYSRREHRWIRGDWQIAPWIFSRVPTTEGRERNPLTILNRWRIFDNLRRSLVPVASLLLLLLGWLISAAPGVWSLVVALAIAIPAFAPLVERWARRMEGSVHGWQGAADQLVRALVKVAFLPHTAWLACDAIVRALFRLRVSRRNLLEWETAASAGANARLHLSATVRQMLLVCFCSLVLFVFLSERGAFYPTFVFLALWVTSPILMMWLNESGVRRPEVTGDDRLFLRRAARRTWRFFDDLVGPENNWLPPDNSQLALRVEVAQRTSPTNIGMWFASALAAHDLGFLTADELWRRTSLTVATIQRLERYEGHLLNWYNTATLEPLTPRYVSTVDSGNLLASLWVLRHGCRDAIGLPVLGEACLRGLADTLAIAREVCGRDVATAEPLRELRRLFRGPAEGHAVITRLRLAAAPVRQLQRPGLGERSYWISRLASELDAWTQTIERYLPWMETLANPAGAIPAEWSKLRRRALHATPSLSALAGSIPSPLEAILSRRGIPETPPDLAAWLDQLAAEFSEAQRNAQAMVKNVETLAATAESFAAGINMRFLYDAPRRLFGVGYAVGGPLEFTSHYDLLASECRLASLAAIAKGDVPVEHWFALGRTRSPSDDGPVLLSWSGTMFEYLMPALFVRSFAGSLLDRACRQAVEKQIEHGHAENLPWGVSEAAFSALDLNQIYQYRAFGVPELALKRGTEDDQVIAPYATMLALMIDPARGIENLQRLHQLGLSGPMGFYESIDFSREKSPDGEHGVVVYAYMAHHQGMSLVALNNVLRGEAMERRFHAELRVRAFESLLFERVPNVREPGEHLEPRHAPVRPRRVEESGTWQEPALVPRAHLNGNGHYLLAATNSGAGFSRWKDFDITRWRSDATLQSWGSYIYIRDLKSQAIWSTTEQPLGRELGASSVTLAADRIQFIRRVSGIETTMHVTVAREDDVEIRRVVAINRSLRTRHIELTSYAELSLAPHRADAAHPAFAKMFVETETPADGVLLAHRRLRSPGDPPVWAAHVLIGASGASFETDRAQFLGRGNTVENPRALTQDLTGSCGTVLDPIFSLRCRVTLEPRDRREIVFLTIAAPSREAVLSLVEKYRRAESITRAFEMAWTRSQLELRYLGVQPSAAHRYHELAGRLLYPDGSLRASPGRLARNRLGQSTLWTYGISGDLPILTVTASDARGVALVRELLLAHNYWRLVGFKADLIVLNLEQPSYDAPLRQQLQRQMDAHSRESIDKPGGIFLRDWNAIPEEHRDLLLAASSVVLHGNRGALHQQLVSPGELEPPAPFTPRGGVAEQPSPSLPFLELPYFNGTGGFTKDAREYCIYLAREDERTPAPWVNVMANPDFGAMVSESGLGFTWNRNSQSNRLTPWHNDPVSDPQSEAIYLRDDESGALWSPTALPIREKDAYRARHGQGYTVFEHNSHAIGQILTVFVPPSDPVKICRLVLRNDSSRSRRLTVTYFAELVLGSVREDQQLHVSTSFDEPSAAVIAWQTWTGSTAGHIAFAAASPRADSWSADRASFFGQNGSRVKPAALNRIKLDGRAGPGLDPAAALQLHLALDSGATAEVSFVLGQAENLEAARAIIVRAFGADLKTVRDQWDSLCGTLQVRTPVLSVDFLVNRWLLYQVLSCRFWGRTALYQSSGAFGFRDQLQDSLAFLYAAPHLTREHILACAARQFPEGDVQHWWHPDTGLGVRTRCSDDMVWLPYVVAHYINVTGDATILDQDVSFLEGPPLEKDQQERMFAATASVESAPLWEHCRRALDHALKLGEHGLPLIGNGDWNDGLNRVGVEGHGESVWLAWFLAAALESFARVMQTRMPDLAESWRSGAEDLAAAVELTSWDGEWYLRGFFDDRSPLGSSRNAEMRIDSIAQSWAVLCGLADAGRARAAMSSADRLLVNERDRLVMLFTPPFDHSSPHPGYIMGYPPGVRENGGQYTHGSLWLAMAHARLRDGDRAVRLLQLMNPIEHSRDPESAAHYLAEPYVSAADVYSAAEKSGRAGWTWYTGSAAWMYRIWIEEVLGLRLRGSMLTIDPVIPSDWPGFSLTFRYRSSVYQIDVIRGADAKPATTIPLLDDGKIHAITVTVPLATRIEKVEKLTPAMPDRNGIVSAAAPAHRTD